MARKCAYIFHPDTLELKPEQAKGAVAGGVAKEPQTKSAPCAMNNGQGELLNAGAIKNG